MNDQEIEDLIQAEKLTAPRVTLADFEANIKSVEIHKHVSKSGKVFRWAIITASNGFEVVGKPSIAVSVENDNAKVGEQVAIDNARSELWPLMGYELHSRLKGGNHEQQSPS